METRTLRDYFQSLPDGGSESFVGDGLIKTPVATEEQAREGLTLDAIMTPVNVKQSIDSEIGVTIATAAQGELAETVLSLSGYAELSSSFQASVNTYRNVRGKAGGSYSLTEITLGNAQSFDGNGSLVTATDGSTVFNLSQSGAALSNIYNSDNALSTVSFTRVSADTSNTLFWTISNLNIPNGGVGALRISGSATYSVEDGTVYNVRSNTLTGTGVFLGSSVSRLNLTNVRLYGKVDYDGDNKGKPRAGSSGFVVNSPLLGGRAVGGHVWSDCGAEALDVGWKFTDAQLHNISNSYADGTSDYGLRLEGSTEDMEIHGFYCGFTLGVYAGGTSRRNTINGLKTIGTGVVPTWGQPSFYNSVGPYYDVTVADTAQLFIDGNSWRGSKRVSVASGAKLFVTGGQWLIGKTVGTVPAATTTYLGVQGQSSSENDVEWRVPQDGIIFLIIPVCTASPGVGNSNVYTARVNGVDTALSATISGSGAFGGSPTYGTIAVSRGQSISIKLVTSATAAAARHQVQLQLLPN